MKKHTAFILTLLLLFCFIGCNKANDVVYTSLVADCYNDEYAMAFDIDYWTGIYFQKENMVDKTCFAFGNSYSGSYKRSIINRMNSYTTDLYVDENSITFGLRSDTGDLVSINFMNSHFFDTQPYLPEVDDPEGTAISLSTEIASAYVDNIAEYTLTSITPVTRYKERDGETYQITYYTLTFVKKIDGYLSSDLIGVKVTSKGTLASITMGDIGAFDGITPHFDTEAMNQSISSKIDAIYPKKKLEVKKSTVEDQRLAINPNGEICMLTVMLIDGVNESNIEVQTGVSILTILGKRSK